LIDSLYSTAKTIDCLTTMVSCCCRGGVRCHRGGWHCGERRGDVSTWAWGLLEECVTRKHLLSIESWVSRCVCHYGKRYKWGRKISPHGGNHPMRHVQKKSKCNKSTRFTIKLTSATASSTEYFSHTNACTVNKSLSTLPHGI